MEAVRITGRISDERLRNGGGNLRNGGTNWDRHCRPMATASVTQLGSGKSLPCSDPGKARELTKRLPTNTEAAEALTELAVSWVLLSPVPHSLSKPKYERQGDYLGSDQGTVTAMLVSGKGPTPTTRS